MHLSIVIPVYNEQDNVLPLHQKLREALAKLDHSFEVILINDGSTDGTRQKLDQVAAEDDRFKVVHFRRNFGQTAAMMAGIDFSTGDVIIPMDGDLQNDPEDIPLLLEKISEGYDVCSGWRKDRKDNALSRNFPSRVANALISYISGVRLNDYGCSLKAYRRSVIKDVRLYGEMHRFIPIYATWLGAKVTQVPVRHHPRVHGRSKYGIERTVKVILDLIVVKFLARYAQKPIYVFGGFGLMNFALAMLSFAFMLYFKYFAPLADRKTFVETPLPSVVVMFVLMGFMSIMMGLIADLVMRTYYESQDKRVYVVESTRNVQEQG